MEDRNIFKDFSNKDLEDLVTYGEASLSFEQMKAIKEEMDNRAIKQEPVMAPKANVLTKKYNGFASLLTLSLVTGVAGTATFMYILLMIGA